MYFYRNGDFQMAIKQVHSFYGPKILYFGITFNGESKYEVHFFVGST